MRDFAENTLGAVGGMTARRPTPFDGTRPYLATADVNGSQIQPAEHYDFRGLPARAGLMLKENDVLQAKMAETDKAVYVSAEMAGWLASTGFAQFSPPQDTLLPAYLYQWLRSEPFFRQKESLCVGSTQKAINQGDLSKIRIRFPDVAGQQRIVDILAAVDDAIAQNEKLIAKTQQIKAGLMHDLFTRGVTPDGQLRPPREQAPDLYQESALGWIPNEWNVDAVDGFCSSIVDCPHSTPEYLSEGIPCIRTADMLPGELLVEQAYCVSQETYRERTSRLVLKCGDVIYSREGERLGIASPVGDVPVCLGQRVMALRPGLGVDPSFLMFAMNTERFYRSVISGLGATTSPHVNVGDIRTKLMPRPGPDEQALIGSALMRVQHQIQVGNAELWKLNCLRAGLMSDLLTGRLAVSAREAVTA